VPTTVWDLVLLLAARPVLPALASANGLPAGKLQMHQARRTTP